MNAALFLVLTLFWGGAYLAIYYVVAVYPPFFAAGVRVLLSTLLMLPFAWSQLRSQRPGRAIIMRCVISGVFFMGFAWALIFWGERFVTPAVTAIVIAATAIVNALFIPFADRGAKVTVHQWFGVICGFLGVLLVFAPHVREGLSSQFFGLLAVLGAAVCYAVGTSMLQSITRTVHGRVIFVWQGLAAGSFLMILSVFTETWPSWELIVHSSTANWALGYLIVVSSTLAFLIYYYLVRAWGGVAATTIVFTVPLVSLVLDAVILRQIPAWPVLAGATIIFAGVRAASLPRSHGPR